MKNHFSDPTTETITRVFLICVAFCLVLHFKYVSENLRMYVTNGATGYAVCVWSLMVYN